MTHITRKQALVAYGLPLGAYKADRFDHTVNPGETLCSCGLVKPVAGPCC